MLRHLCILGVPEQRGPKSEVATSPLPSWGLKRGRTCYVTLAFSGSSTNGTKTRSGCLTLAFPGAEKRAEMLRHPCILGDPQQRGARSEVAAFPLAFLGAQRRTEMLRHPCILDDPQQRVAK